MNRYTTCAVPGCEDRKSSRHRFPNPMKDRERFNLWIEVLANPKLVEMNPTRVFDNFRVCHQHFTINDKSSNMFLKRTAVPSQNLPPKTDIHSLPSSSASYNIEESQNLTSMQLQAEQPSTDERCITPTLEKCVPKTLLKELGVTKSADLTPKAKRLYTKVISLENKSRIYKKRAVALKERLKLAKQMFVASNNDASNDSIKFYMQQLLNKSGPPQGRRYTTEEKLMCLGLYKASGSAYRVLAKWFNLPSQRTIARVLQGIPMKPGINEFIFTHLKKNVDKMKTKEKVCFLMFDEIALLPHVEYRKHEDELLGMENGVIMDHALVFLVKGILSNWKQVVAYKFCKGTVTAANLQTLLTTVIQKLITTGLNVIATVCDQGATNRKAVKDLIQNSRKYYIENNREAKRCIVINGQEITPLFDVPHLMKGIRNNLLTKNLIWTEGEKVSEARWEDIITAYEIDHLSGDVRSIPRITKYHVRRNNIKKMKVCYATQVFSHSMGAAISSMARNNEADATGRFIMNKRAYETVKIIMFFDKLFDSLNGEKGDKRKSKPLRSAVTTTSNHIRFWKQAIKSLKNMYFQTEGTNERKIPPSLQNFIFTIEGFITITERIFSMNYEQYYTRKLNQDAVENFFSQIRQHRGRLINPTCLQFTESYKSLFLRHMAASSHSKMTNCEQTFEMPLIQFKNLNNIDNDTRDGVIIEEPRVHIKIRHEIETNVSNRIMENLLQKLYEIINTRIKCNLCKLHIFEKVPDSTDSVLKKYNPYFLQCISRCYNITRCILNTENITHDIMKTISLYVTRYVYFSFICPHRDTISNLITQEIVLISITEFCRNINNIMQRKINVQYRPDMCNILTQAIDIHNKGLH